MPQELHHTWHRRPLEEKNIRIITVGKTIKYVLDKYMVKHMVLLYGNT